MKVSVAMATYNGAKYLRNQIDSIICQLDFGDELIISDDGSFDDTIGIINSYTSDNRIKLFINPGKGVFDNFANAILHTKNEIIVLSDQDDVWNSTKISTTKSEFSNNDITLLVNDVTYVDGDLKEFENSEKMFSLWKKGVIQNFIRNTYIGCCMSFRRELIDIILPFPKKIPMHDMWIGILTELNGFKVGHTNEKLMLYRRHTNTATKNIRSGIKQIIIWRYNLLTLIIKRQFELKRRAKK